jgi:hypothetical protein
MPRLVQAADIARRHKIDDSALHRHRKAVGLVSRRREKLRIVLDRILERGAEKPISANDVIRAVKAHACLSNDNRWVEPPRTVIHIRAGDPQHVPRKFCMMGQAGEGESTPSSSK